MAVIEQSQPVTAPAPAKQKQVGQSYWSLVWWKFKRNRVALVGGILLVSMYVSFVLFPEFISPYTLNHTSDFAEAPPTRLHFVDAEGNFHARPFIYGLEQKLDFKTRARTYVEDTTKIYPIYFFSRGDAYKLFGFIPFDRHLYGVDQVTNPDAIALLMGSDALGRDWFSRIMYGGRLSLLVGLIGQILTLVFGTILGVMSGYYGGAVDQVIQRSTEFLSAFPEIPLFMALAAAIPSYWSQLTVYFMLTLILSFVRWPFRLPKSTNGSFSRATCCFAST